MTNVAQATTSLFSAPIEGIGEVLQGRNFAQVIEDKGKKALGAYTSIATGGGIATTDAAQRLLRDKTVSALTLGTSENYAGFTNVGKRLASEDEVSQSEWNLAGRFVAQTAAVAGAAAYGVTGTQLFTTQNYGTALVASPMLARGDLKGLATLAGVPPVLGNLLPSNPATPPRTTQPTAGPTQAQTPSADYWGSNGGAVGNSFGAFGMSTETLILTGAAIAAGLILSRRL